MKTLGTIVILLCVIGLAGCADTPAGDGLPDEVTCDSCHGGPDSPAPPVALDGSTETTDRGVGAHTAHLVDGPLRAALACDECHVVPDRVDAAGHIDTLPAEVIFGALAQNGGLTPAWNREQETCTSTWCHGGDLAGGSNTAPVWTRVGSGQAACGSCHGLPPPAPHPQMSRCAACHPTTVDESGSILPGGTHINGQRDVVAQTCHTCHGSDDNPAPPVSVSGASDPSDPAVGAHQAHLTDGHLRPALACSECHQVPDAIDAPGHLGDLPAELIWGPLATASGLSPVYNRQTETCASTWCHGAGLSGGSNTTPVWTVVDGSQKACGTCHGIPPDEPHPQSTRCQDCHGGTVGPDGSLLAEDGLHIDGQVEAAGQGCGACHGSTANPAPPLSLSGASSTDDLAVGAHQAHLQDGSLRRAIACAECHQVPGAVDDEGHLGELPADMTWGALATAGGLTPEWDREAASCESTWCHGAGLSGGSNTAPVWTTVDGSQIACGTCHGNPPPAPHPQSDTCWNCHAGTVAPDGSIRLDGAHMNGVVEPVDLGSCISCHGSADNPAPPLSLSGESSTDLLAVGAHQSHLQDGRVRQAIGCDECHLVPSAWDDAGHLDASPAELTFGGLATHTGLQPEWDREAGTCANTYCHGATLSGGSVPTPVWTELNGSQAACWSCHGLPPPAPHPQSNDCQGCHPETIVSNAIIDVAGGKHIDGTVQFVAPPRGKAEK